LCDAGSIVETDKVLAAKVEAGWRQGWKKL
jgi:hypothetical protein